MKRFYPFWIIDPVGTEKKIDDLSEKGYRLSDMNFFGLMSFEEAAPQKKKHCIVLEKGGLPRGAQLRGWECLCQKKLFYVAANEDASETMSYASYIKIHSYAKVAIFTVICFYIGMCAGMLGALSDMDVAVIPPEKAAELVRNIICALALIVLTLVVHMCGKKIPKEDLRLSGALKTIPAENFVYSAEEEKQMLKDGRMMKKMRPGWFDEPDRAAEYVNRQNEQGWRFYRFDAAGVTFYFVKEDAPVRQTFVVDFQGLASDEYYVTAKDDGWKLEFTSISRTMGYSIWTKLYGEDEQKPEFYSDIQSEYARAKKFLIVFGLSFLLLLLVSVSMVGIAVKIGSQGDNVAFMIYLSVIYVILVIEYGLFLSKIIGYFVRVKNKMKK